MTKVILVRHGEAQGNIERFFQGWTDGHLSDKGHMQAECAGEYLKDEKIDILYASSLTRTQQTASHIAKFHDLEINVMDDLREINGGDWENVPFDDLPKRWPKEYETWNNDVHLHCMPNGESMEELFHRFKNAMARLIEKHEGETLCVVSHGTAIRTYMTYLLGIDFSQMPTVPWFENTAITVFEIDGEKINLIKQGSTEHLSDEMCTLKHQDWYKK